MSLINQMLRDLEKRRLDHTPPPINPTYLSSEPRRLKPKLSHALLALVALLAITCGITFRQQFAHILANTSSDNAVPATTTNNAVPQPETPETTMNNAAPTIVQSSTATELENVPQSQPITPPVEEPTPTTDTQPQTETQHSALAQVFESRHPSSLSAEATPETDETAHWQTQHINSKKVKHHKHLKARVTLAANHASKSLVLPTSAHLPAQDPVTEYQKLDNSDLPLRQAKTLISQQQTEAALKLLQSIKPSPAKSETHMALMAAAHQQNGNAQQATEAYQQLLSKKPDKAEYWLGLGMSQEKNGDIKAAREAYAQALSKNRLNAPVIDYIKQRQSALNSE